MPITALIVLLTGYGLPLNPNLAPQSSNTSAISQRKPVQVWEKTVAPGINLREVYDPNLPRLVFGLRLSHRSKESAAEAVLAGGTVFEDTPSKGRTTVTKMVADNKAIGGVNGDFFPFTGDPLNIAVHNGTLLSLPYFNAAVPSAYRSAVAWGPGYIQLGYARTSIKLIPTSGSSATSPTLVADGLNEEPSAAALVLDTENCGLAMAKKPNSFAVLTVSGPLKPNGEIKATVTNAGQNLTKQPVGPGTAVLIGTGPSASEVAGLAVGTELTIKTTTTGFDFNKATEAIGGGPQLVHGGKVAVNAEIERFTGTFETNRHPRTAIGVTSNGDTWLVVIDGRTKESVGATLKETAEIMVNFGCKEAMNLDGGGSSALNLFGLTLNHPSDGLEREVADGVLFAGPAPRQTDESLKIAVPNQILEKHTYPIAVTDGDGHKIPNSEVVWAFDGSVWVDQGATLHARFNGSGNVYAFCHGHRLQLKVTVGTY